MRRSPSWLIAGIEQVGEGGSGAFYREWQVPEPLSAIACRIYVLKDDGRMTAVGEHRFPTHCFDLQISYTEGNEQPSIRYQHPVAERRRRKRAFHGWVFGVRFQRDVSDLLGRAPAALWLSLFHEHNAVISRHSAGADLSGAMGPLLSYLVAQSPYPVDGERSGHARSVAELATKTNVSERTLRRKVRQETGLNPKTLVSLARFDGLLTSAVTGDDGLAAAAADMGFTDQSHMHREFKKRTGMTPGQFRKRWRDRQEVVAPDGLVSLKLD